MQMVATAAFGYALGSEGTGDIFWQNYGNVLVDDSSYSEALLQTNHLSENMKVASPLALSIPSDATIQGVELVVSKHQSAGALIQDAAVYMVVGGIVGAANKASSSYWPESDTDSIYFGPTDMGGNVLIPSDLDADFGFVLIAKSGPGSPPNANALIRYMYMRVYYTVPDLSVSMSASPSEGAAPLNVNFATVVSGGTAPYSYSLDPGDGTPPVTGTGTPNHSYVGVGTFVATMTVTDSLGASGTATATITTTGTSVLLVAATRAPAIGYAPVLVGFEVSAIGGTPPYSYYWDFGDGTAQTLAATALHEYQTPGLYVPFIRVTDSVGNVGYGKQDLSVQVLASSLTGTILAVPNSGDAPLGVNFSVTITGGIPGYSYNWNFGDGSSPAHTPAPSHLYTIAGNYTVTLDLQDALGQKATLVGYVTVTENGVGVVSLSISADQTSGGVGDTFQFYAAASGGVEPYDITWDFGDGTTLAATGDATHQYAASGLFYVQATLQDSSVPPVTVTSNRIGITVSATGDLRALPSVSPQTGYMPLVVTCAASGTGGTGPYTYVWKWGDGSGDGSGASASHTYSAVGTYTLYLVVTDSTGTTAYSSPITIIVTQSGTPPGSGGSASFTWMGSDDTTPQADLLYSFYLEPYEAGYGAWVPDTSKVYTGLPSGSYVFHVRAQDEAGQDSTPADWPFSLIGSGGTSLLVSVTEDIHAASGIPATVNFVGMASGGVEPYAYAWSFGDGTPSATGASTQHTYTATGTFEGSLSVTDANGKVSTATFTKTFTDSGTPVGHSISGQVTYDGHSLFSVINNNDTVGHVPWTNKLDAGSVDSIGAYATLTTKASNYLVVKWPQAADIPAGTAITGMALFVRIMGTGTVKFRRIAPIKHGNIFDGINATPDRSKTSPDNFPASWTWVSFGGPGDLWDIPNLTIDDVLKKTYGFAIQAEPVDAGGEASIDAAYVVLYYSGMPTYPIGIASVEIDALPYNPTGVGGSASSNSSGNYTIPDLVDDNYTLDPNYDASDNGWIIRPAGIEVSLVGVDVTGQDFAASPIGFPLVKKNTPGKSANINCGPAATWKYFYAKSRGTAKVTFQLKNISGGNVDLYVMKGSLPDESDYDGKSTLPSTSDEEVKLKPTGGLTYWFIGVRAVPTGSPGVIGFTVKVTQPVG